MNKYEMMYIIAGEAEENVREELMAKIETLIKSEGGEIESVEKMGMKKFQYPIHYKTEGFYVLVNFTAKAEFIAELDRRMRINDNIVRQLIVAK